MSLFGDKSMNKIHWICYKGARTKLGNPTLSCILNLKFKIIFCYFFHFVASSFESPSLTELEKPNLAS